MSAVIEDPDALVLEVAEQPEEPDVQVIETEDEPEADAPAAKPAKATEPVDGVDDLRAKLAAAGRAKEEAAERARQAEERATKFEREATANRSQVASHEYNVVSANIETLNSQIDAIKRAMVEANSQGDYAKAADFQEQLTEQATYRANLKNWKSQYEARAKNPQPQPQQRQVAGDPVEAIAANLQPRSAAWVRAHPQFVKGGQLSPEVLTAHQAALDDGILPDSNRYFAFVEDHLGLTKAEPKPAPVPRRAPVAAAPVSRDAPAISGSASSEVRVTKAQIDAGIQMGLTKKDVIDAAVKMHREAQGR